MSDPTSLVGQYGPLAEEFSAALAAGDAARIQEALDAIVQTRESSLFNELRKLTADLQETLKRFRLSHIANKAMPDARERLDHAIKMTDKAAHRTMDLIEQSAPIADRACQAATALSELWRRFRAQEPGVPDLRAMIERTVEFLTHVQTDAGTVRNNLNEVVMAQGYQDLSGQIIRSVMQLVQPLENALVDLVRLSQLENKSGPTGETGIRKTLGPAIPGLDKGNVVSGQQDVDSMLSKMGL
jgi:chemotaxis protein CheZ